MLCPNCRQEIKVGSEFCGNCGVRIGRHPVGPTCPACGSPVLPGAEFCVECGAKLTVETVPAQSFCPECGAAVEQGNTFCVVCGTKLAVETVSAPAFCPECGVAVQPGDTFCVECGARLTVETVSSQAFCPDCGAAVEPGDTFCVECGARLTASAATESRQAFQLQMQLQPQSQPQDWSPQQQDWAQPQAQGILAKVQQQGRGISSLLQGAGPRKMLMAVAAAVILLVIGITGLWKPGFLLDLFRPTAKLENGMLALNDISLDFKQTNLANGKATLTTVRDKEEELNNGLISDLYVMKVDKSCKGKVTVSVPVPKNFKPTTGNGLYIKLGVGQDYTLADGKKERYYDYFDATVKDEKAVAVIDPAALGRSVRKSKASSAASAEKKKPDLGEFTEYVGFFFKQGLLMYGEGYENSKGHFRLWYNYNPTGFVKNVYMGGDEAQKVLSDLEEAHNYYKTHGYEEHVDTFTPIDVYITRCKDEGGWNAVTGNIELKESSMFGVDYNLRYEGDQRIKTKVTIYHEFFHAVQQSMIGSLTNALGLMKSNWFGEATATHFERLVVPDEVTENGKKLFWRLWQGPIPEGNGADDGYARGLLVDYLSNKLGGDDWIKECYKHWVGNTEVTYYMRKIAQTEADFAAKFYMELIRNRKLAPLYDPSYYYTESLNPNKREGADRFVTSIRLGLDDKTKEKMKKGEEDAFPVVFISPSFELAGYGGRVVGLITKDTINKKPVDLTGGYPEKCQLKLEAEGGCQTQIIRFSTGKSGEDNIVKGNVIKNFKEQIDKGYRFLVLVTSTQPKKQNIRLKATLDLMQPEEGIYNGKATVTQGKKTVKADKRVFFRLTKSKDKRWSVNPCDANGNYPTEVGNIPLTYDAKQDVWKGNRKYKEDVSRNPDRPKIEKGEFNCSMKVNLEGTEPVLIIDYKAEGTTWKWGLPTNESYIIHFEGKWVSELKGRNLGAELDAKAKIVE